MNIVVTGAAAASTSSPTTSDYAAVRMRQLAVFTEATCVAAGRRLRRAVSDRREALELRLQEFVLELLAAIVLIAIFMIVTEPTAGEDH